MDTEEAQAPFSVDSFAAFSFIYVPGTQTLRIAMLGSSDTDRPYFFVLHRDCVHVMEALSWLGLSSRFDGTADLEFAIFRK